MKEKRMILTGIKVFFSRNTDIPFEDVQKSYNKIRKIPGDVLQGMIDKFDTVNGTLTSKDALDGLMSAILYSERHMKDKIVFELNNDFVFNGKWEKDPKCKPFSIKEILEMNVNLEKKI